MDKEKKETVSIDFMFQIIFTSVLIITVFAVLWSTATDNSVKGFLFFIFLLPAAPMFHDGGDRAFFAGIIYIILIILGIVIGNYHYHWQALIILIVLYFGCLLFEKFKKQTLI